MKVNRPPSPISITQMNLFDFQISHHQPTSFLRSFTAAIKESKMEPAASKMQITVTTLSACVPLSTTFTTSAYRFTRIYSLNVTHLPEFRFYGLSTQ